MISKHYPTLDVHGETRDTVIFPVKEFIQDNWKLGNKYIVIIHGNGKDILKHTVHDYLKKDPKVEEYCFDGLNLGATIVTLNLESKFDK